jgi:hypothetical protein
VVESVGVGISTSVGPGSPTPSNVINADLNPYSVTITSSSTSANVIDGFASPNLHHFLSNFHNLAPPPSCALSHTLSGSLEPLTLPLLSTLVEMRIANGSPPEDDDVI